MLEDERELEEIRGWLNEHWPDRVFEGSYLLRGEYSGTYTRHCSIIKRAEQDFILKYYHRSRGHGVRAEKRNYDLFGKHQVFPRLEALFPKGSDSPDFMHYGILISYYPHKVSPAGISIVEALAIGVSLATTFGYFAEEGCIYFDLRADSLRVDSAGGLHLIDFSDLIKIDELLKRPNPGLPVIDRQSKFIPPEGFKYQSALQNYFRNKITWSIVRDVAQAIHPERYQVFTLAGLIIEILFGVAADDSALRARIAQAGEPKDGAFSAEERSLLWDLLRSMQDPDDVARPSFVKVADIFWSLLSPRLKSEPIAANWNSRRAAKLLRTISRRDGDVISSQIHEGLTLYWST